MWIAIWILLGASLLTCGVCRAYAFDKLVAVERAHHHAAWVQDGKPCPGYLNGGLVWERSIKTTLASQRCAWQWVANPPAWIGASPLATMQQRRLKLFGRTSLLVTIVAAGAFMFQTALR